MAAIIKVNKQPNHIHNGMTPGIHASISDRRKTKVINLQKKSLSPTSSLLIIICFILFITLAAIMALLDISDSWTSSELRKLMDVTTTDSISSVYKDLLDDGLALDGRISLISKSSKRKLENNRSKSDLHENVIAQKAPQSPQQLVTQVFSIIEDTNHKLSQPQRLARSIVEESLRQNFDPLFVAAVIKSESAFNEMAVSNVGAQGLMQIMPATGKYLAKKQQLESDFPQAIKLSDPQVNIKLGVKYLKELEDMYDGNRLLTLVAYNWGPGKLDRAIQSGRGVPAECMHYALKILKDHNGWQQG